YRVFTSDACWWIINDICIRNEWKKRCQLVIGCVDIHYSLIGISKPCDATSFLNFKFLVDYIIQREVVPTFCKFDWSKHVKLTFRIDLEFQIAVSTTANNIT